MLPYRKEKNYKSNFQSIEGFWCTNAVTPSHWETSLQFPLTNCFLSKYPLHRRATSSSVFLLSASQPFLWLLLLWYVKLRSQSDAWESDCNLSVFGVWPSQTVEKFELVANLRKSGYFMLKSRYFGFLGQTRCGDSGPSSQRALFTLWFKAVSHLHLAL